MLVSDFAARWPGLFPRTLDTDRHNASMVKPFLARFGSRDLNALDPLRVIAWANTHPRHARYARTLLADAVRARLLDTNPLQGVAVRQPPAGEHYQPTVAEVDRLVAVADDLHGELFGTMALTAAYSAMRFGQIVAVGREDISAPAEPRRAAVCAQKRNPAREVALLVPCRERLREAVPSRRSGLVFVRKRAAWSSSSFSRAWLEVREASGVPARFHDLRGFCATYMVDRGVQPIDLAMQLHGSRDPQTVLKFYARPSQSAALDRIEEAVGA